MPDTSRTWDGGYISKDSKGRDVYVIRRQIDGKRFEVSTRCHTSGAAHVQLKRFESDPSRYSPRGTDHEDAVILTKELTTAFLKWSLDVKGNTKKWVGDQRRAMSWWGAKLGQVDLRRLTDRQLVKALDGAPGRKQRIATIKVFYAWLINERHELERTQDPTIGIAVPQSQPEQWTTNKVIPREDYLKVAGHLSQHWRDAIDVLAGTGWHVSELVRFARGGAVEKHPQSERSVVVCPLTKGGAVLKTEVSDPVAGAAGRLRKKGGFSDRMLYTALAKASEDAGVDLITPGRFRHSVATWAINSGAAPAAVAAFLGHRSQQTTKKFYATHAVPAKVPTLA